MVQATKRLERHGELFRAFWGAAQRAKALGAGDDPIERAALFVLRQVSDHGPVRVSDLCPHLMLDLSTISRQVRALEEHGLVQRSESSTDRRASLLTPTERGRELLEEATHRRAAALAEALSGWSTTDVDQLTRLLLRFTDDLTSTVHHDEENV